MRKYLAVGTDPNDASNVSRWDAPRMIARLVVVDDGEEYEQRPVVVDHRGVAVPIPSTAGFDFGQQFAHRLRELVALRDRRATHPHFRGHGPAFLLKRSGCLGVGFGSEPLQSTGYPEPARAGSVPDRRVVS